MHDRLDLTFELNETAVYKSAGTTGPPIVRTVKVVGGGLVNPNPGLKFATEGSDLLVKFLPHEGDNSDPEAVSPAKTWSVDRRFIYKLSPAKAEQVSHTYDHIRPVDVKSELNRL
jgi:hypothetical protein